MVACANVTQGPAGWRRKPWLLKAARRPWRQNSDQTVNFCQKTHRNQLARSLSKDAAGKGRGARMFCPLAND
eukprot:9323231-Pyramimonas_sp.AAC.1